MNNNDAFDQMMKDAEFRATYFELLFWQATTALGLCCGDLGTVRAGMQSLEETVEHYMESAKASELFNNIIDGEEKKPPRALFSFLMKKIEESKNATSDASAPTASNDGQAGSDI